MVTEESWNPKAKNNFPHGQWTGTNVYPNATWSQQHNCDQQQRYQGNVCYADGKFFMNFGKDQLFILFPVVAIIFLTLTWKDPQFDEEMDFQDFFGMDRWSLIGPISPAAKLKTLYLNKTIFKGKLNMWLRISIYTYISISIYIQIHKQIHVHIHIPVPVHIHIQMCT